MSTDAKLGLTETDCLDLTQMLDGIGSLMRAACWPEDDCYLKRLSPLRSRLLEQATRARESFEEKPQ